MAADDDVSRGAVAVPINVSARFMCQGAVVILAAAGLGVAAGAATIDAVWSRVAAGLVAVGCAIAVFVMVTRPRVLLRVHALELRGAYSMAVVPWSEVLALHLQWTASRRGVGYDLFVRTVPPGPSRLPSLPVLSDDAVWMMRRFVNDHGIDVPVNPAEPWRDRLGVWHGPLLEFDPLESIRTIRRAAVGPWLVTVRARGDRFEAVSVRADTGEATDRSPLRETLADAVDDGVGHVQRLRVQLTDDT